MRSGRCAIVGLPNVGKSTLLNTLVGQKIAIVTPKPQTTRTCLLGIYASDEPLMQIGFVDTPGLHRPTHALGRLLVEEIRNALEGIEAVLIVVDCTSLQKHNGKLSQDDAGLIERAKRGGVPFILALNKVDKIRNKEELLPWLSELNEKYSPHAIIPLSARKGVNVDRIVKAIYEILPEGKLYEDDVLTDKPSKYFAAEFVREAVMAHTRDELPYQVAVTIERFQEEPAIVHIDAVIVVAKEAHKKIVIGKRGSLLKQIGTEARLGLQTLLDKKIMLKTWVKVEENWPDHPRQAQELVAG